jgi:hypothetical protein
LEIMAQVLQHAQVVEVAVAAALGHLRRPSAAVLTSALRCGGPGQPGGPAARMPLCSALPKLMGSLQMFDSLPQQLQPFQHTEPRAESCSQCVHSVRRVVQLCIGLPQCQEQGVDAPASPRQKRNCGLPLMVCSSL